MSIISKINADELVFFKPLKTRRLLAAPIFNSFLVLTQETLPAAGWKTKKVKASLAIISVFCITQVRSGDLRTSSQLPDLTKVILHPINYP